MTQSTRELVLERRQSDTGWGWALAYLLPFVGIYHMWTRRTLTPMLIYISMSILTGIAIGLSDSYDKMNEAERDAMTSAVGTLLFVPAVKVGIALDNKEALRKAQK